MSRFQRSWQLFKCSLAVIRGNRTLLLFPIVITLLTCVIALFFLAPIALWNTGHSYTDSAHWQAVAHRWVTWDAGGKELHVNPAGYVLLASFYLVSTFLATFFSVAFYSQILSALRGQPASLSGGIRSALGRLGPILAWSLFTGLVGLLIKTLEERVGIVGRWIIRLIGIAWSVASVFAVPVIVLGEPTANPVRVLKSSASLLRRTWGEALVGFVGIRIGGILAVVMSLILLGSGIALAIILKSVWIVAVAFVLWAVGLVAFMYLVNVASQVYLGALYLYASEGAAPAPFDESQMHAAWKVKGERGQT